MVQIKSREIKWDNLERAIKGCKKCALKAFQGYSKKEDIVFCGHYGPKKYGGWSVKTAKNCTFGGNYEEIKQRKKRSG